MRELEERFAKVLAEHMAGDTRIYYGSASILTRALAAEVEQVIAGTERPYLAGNQIEALAAAIYRGGGAVEWLSTVDDTPNTASWDYARRIAPVVAHMLADQRAQITRDIEALPTRWYPIIPTAYAAACEDAAAVARREEADE